MRFVLTLLLVSTASVRAARTCSFFQNLDQKKESKEFCRGKQSIIPAKSCLQHRYASRTVPRLKLCLDILTWLSYVLVDVRAWAVARSAIEVSSAVAPICRSLPAVTNCALLTRLHFWLLDFRFADSILNLSPLPQHHYRQVSTTIDATLGAVSLDSAVFAPRTQFSASWSLRSSATASAILKQAAASLQLPPHTALAFHSIGQLHQLDHPCRMLERLNLHHHELVPGSRQQRGFCCSCGCGSRSLAPTASRSKRLATRSHHRRSLQSPPSHPPRRSPRSTLLAQSSSLEGPARLPTSRKEGVVLDARKATQGILPIPQRPLTAIDVF